MKLFFYDIETTGTMHWRNGVHQISGLVEINGQVRETFDFKVKPNPSCTIEDEALKVANVTREQVNAYPEMKEVHANICRIMTKYVDKFRSRDKFFLVGYNNASFDNQFFRAFFVQCQDNYFGSWFWSSSIDVMVLAAEYLKEKRAEMIDFKLKTVAQFMGIVIDESKLHDAAYDIDLTRTIYKKITEKITNG